jgi:hypothetical protein
MDRSGLPHPDPPAKTGAEPTGTIPKPDDAIWTCATLGVDVGSVNVKACGLAGHAVRHAVVPHEGDVEAVRGSVAALDSAPRPRRPRSRREGDGGASTSPA